MNLTCKVFEAMWKSGFELIVLTPNEEEDPHVIMLKVALFSYDYGVKRLILI